MITDQQKEKIYNQIIEELTVRLVGESSRTARYASTVCLLHTYFESFLWTGFYLKDPNKEELVVGPYQGNFGCLRIPFGQGVCGEVAEKEETLVIAEVQKHKNHIPCDPGSRSEMVVPLLNKREGFLGVLDIDSTIPNYFSDIDKEKSKEIIKIIIGL